ncbi:sigma 54-interacting transcriptional regulator [Anoxynatronum sibiricum]|uniref:Sigma 54-interacting transcriptional regulator n=1 Tax=Anoxynatronum sibiricum TaxID=210623 RepID=A0ABU9VTN4_9CLOT
MNLMLMQDVIVKYSEAISTVLDVDVVIIDRYYTKIAYTTRNVSDALPITSTTVVGEAMNKGEVIIIENKENYPICQNCEDASECMIAGMISVPIFSNHKAVGAVALLFHKANQTDVFKNVGPAVHFVEIIADLISSKLLNIEDMERLRLTSYDRESIINAVDDAIISFDVAGKVSYYNKRFTTEFPVTGPLEGKQFSDIFHHSRLDEIYRSVYDELNRPLFYEYQQKTFIGSVTKKNRMVNGIKQGSIFIFKNLNANFISLRNLLDHGAEIGFQHLVDADEVFQIEIEKAKEMAVTDDDILIESEPGLEVNELARAIHNYSDRSEKVFKKIDFAQLTMKEIESTMLEFRVYSEGNNFQIGDLNMANGGTVFLRNVQRMPLFTQSFILQIVKGNSVYSESFGLHRVDLRFIVHSEVPLEPLVKAGHFSEALYHRISGRKLTIPPLRKRKKRIRQILLHIFEEMKRVYENRDIRLSSEAVEVLANCHWPQNRISVEAAMEKIVRLANVKLVTEEHVVQVLPDEFERKNGRFETYQMEEIERKIIIELLQKGYEKERIAREMGIGRATLYRKMDKYGICAEDHTAEKIVFLKR